ncbi:MAG: molecular chaperone HtpG, partial [Polaribacter sp.]|nr:molecular chaperone HtpG [Polaribacter sp.]
FLKEDKIKGLLNKYNRFNQVPIKFGTKKVNDPDFTPQTTTDKDGKETTEPHKKIDVDNIINNTNPAWTKAPADLSDEDYENFYRELYPMQFEESLFHIHLNVDYPFNLTGILFFPKLSSSMDMQKDKIQLYQNQVYVTDNVEGIVPDFLQMLKGVIDSPDIPLNVSRSYLQADGAVKKISGYITKKVADKLTSLFKNNREDFEKKWNDIKVIIEYGMLSEDKFFDKAKKFALYPTVADTYFTFDELIEKTKDNQTDKDGNHVILYASNKDAQHSYIESATAKGYEVLVLDSPIISHLMQKLEGGDAKVKFTRVDADFIDNLIKKDDAAISKLSEEEKTTLKPIIETAIASEAYTVQLEAMDSDASPFIITVPEFMRRMKEMQASGGGGMMGMGNFPDMYNLVVNTNSPLISNILNSKDADAQKHLISQAFDLAKLSQNLLHGKELTSFIKRSYELIK